MTLAIHAMKATSNKWYGWKPDKPDKNDKKYAFKPKAIRLPSHATLPVEAIPDVRNQKETGACTGFSSTSAMNCARIIGGQPPLVLSPAFAYYNGRAYEGTIGDDSGCEIRDVLKMEAKYGCAPEKLWPYPNVREGDFKPFTVKPSVPAYYAAKDDMIKTYSRIYGSGGARLNAIKQAIVCRQPVVFGFTVYENFSSADKAGKMEMPSGSTEGGHAIWAVAYDDDLKIFKIQNSWDTDWGDHGYFYMPYAYAAEPDLSDDFWALKVIS